MGIYIDHNLWLEPDEERVIDFLPSINGGSPSEMRILRMWCEYFKERGIPYIVLERGKCKGVGSRGYREDYPRYVLRKYGVPLEPLTEEGETS